MPVGYTTTPRFHKTVEIFNILDPNCEFAKYDGWGVGPVIRIVTPKIYLEIWTSPDNPDYWEWYINPDRSSMTPGFQGVGPSVPGIAFDIFRDFGLIPPKST